MTPETQKPPVKVALADTPIAGVICHWGMTVLILGIRPTLVKPPAPSRSTVGGLMRYGMAARRIGERCYVQTGEGIPDCDWLRANKPPQSFCPEDHSISGWNALDFTKRIPIQIPSPINSL